VPLSIAPSATSYLCAVRHAATLHPARPPRALVVGRPDLSASEWKRLPPLPMAEREAEAVAERYPDHTLLVGGAATAEAFLAALPDYQVVHFAGHAVELDGDVDGGWLALAPGPTGGSGAVEAGRLRGLDLARTELVVLSVCRGLSGFATGREGPVGLASAFFAAGVPTVVAALWEVDDQVSYGLMTRFHELVAEGRSPGEALRELMIQEIHSSDPGRRRLTRWGVFAVLGS
jgi:CHAT domain-containing protein